MIHESCSELLRAICEATKAGRIRWSVDPQDKDCFRSTKVGSREILIDFLYVEPTNTGADRHIVHVFMEDVNFFAACGTESFALVLEILAEGIDEWREHVDDVLGGHRRAMERLSNLADQEKESSVDEP